MSTANTSSKPSVKSINRKEEKVTDKLGKEKKKDQLESENLSMIRKSIVHVVIGSSAERI